MAVMVIAYSIFSAKPWTTGSSPNSLVTYLQPLIEVLIGDGSDGDGIFLLFRQTMDNWQQPILTHDLLSAPDQSTGL